MSRLKILNAEPQGYSAEAREILSEVAEVQDGDGTRAGLIAAVGDADVLIVRLKFRVDDEIFSRAPKLKILATATTGLTHVDEAAAARRGIEVLNLKGLNDFLGDVTATAEHAWGLLLSLIRHIPRAHADVVSGAWRRDDFRGRELCGKTLGVIGYGRLGRMVAQYGIAFRMTVLACDPFARDENKRGIKRIALDELLAASDVVSVHAALNDGTKGLLDATRLSQMKSGAVLINTARGAIVDEKALLAALSSGQLAGAALDVLAGEHDGAPGSDWPASDALVRYARENSNLILTPHLGGATFESMATTEKLLARRIREKILMMASEGGVKKI